jgi:hypothetical protein
VVNLTQCPRLREALFGGTNVVAVNVADGSKVEHLQLPASITVLDVRNTKFLEQVELPDLTHLGFLRLENNAHINGFEKLKEAFGVDGNALQNIRIVSFEYDGDATDVDMLATLANGKFFGIDGEGNQTTSTPVVEGTLNVAGSIYEDAGSVVEAKYPNLTLNVLGGYYLRFADPVVAQICADNWGDKVGITKEQAAAVTSIGTVFKGNTAITNFMEFAENFVNLTNIPSYAFSECTNLESIDIPQSVTSIGERSFGGCTSLYIDDLSLPNLLSLGTYALENVKIRKVSNIEKMTSYPSASYKNILGCDTSVLESFAIPSSIPKIKEYLLYGCSALTELLVDWSKITAVGRRAFEGCSSLYIEKLSIPNLTSLGDAYVFQKVKIKHIVNLGSITSTANGNYGNFVHCDVATLRSVIFPATLTTINADVLRDCKALEAVIIKATTPPSLGLNPFNSSPNVPIYVYGDNSVINAYQTASNWSAYASRIFHISQLATDNPELYAEIEEYL